MTKLPEWLDKLIPELTLPVNLTYADGKYYAHYPEGQEYPDSTLSEAFGTFPEAYDSVKIESGYAVVFDESLPEMKDLLIGGLITIDSGDGWGRLFISSTEANSLNILENFYSSWITFAENEYLQHTDDFLCSYYFVDRHPAFWTRDKAYAEKSKGKVGWHDHWTTTGHTKRIDHSVVFSENSPTKVSFNIETGPHISPEYVIHSCDLRLEVYGESYEKAIIKLAEKIHKFYNLDGTPRENVEYEASALEKLLVERLSADRTRRSSIDITDTDSNS